MNLVIKKFNNFFSNFESLGSLFLRFAVGVAFIIYGIGKFPLPPEGLVEYFDLPPLLASIVAISEVSSGILLIVAQFYRLILLLVLYKPLLGLYLNLNDQIDQLYFLQLLYPHPLLYEQALDQQLHRLLHKYFQRSS